MKIIVIYIGLLVFSSLLCFCVPKTYKLIERTQQKELRQFLILNQFRRRFAFVNSNKKAIENPLTDKPLLRKFMRQDFAHFEA